MQYKWVALTVTIVGTLMSGLDDRIIVIGLPTIIKQVGTTVGEGIWIGQAYTLALSFALLLVGRITDLHGRVKIYNIGFVIFTIGSGLASISSSVAELIIFRLVQGVGASMLSANSIAIVTDATPQNELGTFIGFNRVAFRVGAVMGLTLSGVILSFTDWRALFYINIPIGIFGTIWARRRLREVSTRDTTKKMDWVGFLTFTSGITLILVALTFLSYGVADSIESIAMLSSGSILLVAFVVFERKASEAPLLDLKLFKIRAFASGSTVAMFSMLAWNGMIYMASFFLQIVLGLTPLQAGLAYLFLELPYLVVGAASGKLADKYGARGLATVGLAILGVACLYASAFSSSTIYSSVLVLFLLLAVGQGLFTSPNQKSIMGSVPANRRGVAAGFSGTIAQVGNAAGPVLAITLITLGIPYGVFTTLVQNAGSLATQIAKEEFVSGFKIAALTLGIVSAVAIIPSYMRGKTMNGSSEDVTTKETTATSNQDEALPEA
ncbi:MAG: MFS transporter [Nitrososphaerales archaeon]